MDKKTPAGGGFSSPELEARGLQAVFDEPFIAVAAVQLLVVWFSSL